MKFEFATAGRIVFGSGSLSEAVSAVGKYGKSVFLVTGAGNTLTLRLEEELRKKELDVQSFRVEREPTIDLVDRGVSLARGINAQVVVGFGGGSAIDLAKAIAGLSTNPGPVLTYLEVVGGGRPLVQAALPMIAVPTTAGTGSEVTRNAVILVPEKRVKVSLRSPMLIPRIAVIDPDLTQSLPSSITASTGMDALTQVIEPFVSIRANPIVDGFCREGFTRAGRSLYKAYCNGLDRHAREDMCYTSLMGGLALANGGLGAVHGFAAPIGGMFPIPHGVLCARLLGPVVRANLRAIQARDPEHPSLAKYSEAAHLVMGEAMERVVYFADWIEDLCHKMNIPRLSDLNVTRDSFDAIVVKAAAASSMQANPIRLEHNELLEILAQAL
jgi:alcohol dehydrogenase class IV